MNGNGNRANLALAGVILALAAALLGCNPPGMLEPKTKIIDLTVSSSDYQTVGLHSYVYVYDDAIQPDREIEVYWLEQGQTYWIPFIDVNVEMAMGGGHLRLLEESPQQYLGDKIRVIVTWHEEQASGS